MSIGKPMPVIPYKTRMRQHPKEENFSKGEEDDVLLELKIIF